MANPTLLVPVKIKALVVNPYVLANQPFRRWGEVYTNVKQFGSAEPDPTDRGGGFAGSGSHTGVYLHWELPDALKHGIQNQQTREIEFPHVPNRWLVVRFSGALTKRTAQAFVVESDAPGDASSATYAFDPAIIEAWKQSKDPKRQQAGSRLSGSDKQVADLLGQAFDLAGWSEKGIEQLFVTAVAPGNPLFSAYQSHCQNVFSFHDTLDGVDPDSTLSYMVTGWFSNGAEDPLLKCQNDKPLGSSAEAACEQLLAGNSWSAAPADGEVPTSSLYHGMVFGVKWSQAGTFPTIKDKYKDQSDKGIHVAIGNTSTDAFKALIDRQIHDRAANGDADALQLLKELPNAADLLEAFQYDMLHILDQPSGWNQLDYRIRQEWFGSKPGGYRWAIVDAQSDQPQPKSAALRQSQAQQESWLAQLNSDQAALDAALQELYAAQWQLYATWWKQGKFGTYPPFAKPDGITDDQFRKALAADNDPSYDASKPPGPDNIYSLPRRVYDLMNQVSRILAPKVPQPLYSRDNSTPELALAAGIEAFTAQKRTAGLLRADRELKSIASPRYWGANDPVVLISGAGNTSQIQQSDGTLACRLSTQLVDALKDGTAVVTPADLGGSIPSLPVSDAQLAAALQGGYISPETAGQLAAVLHGLLTEFFLLDPDNAASISTPYPVFTRELLAKHDPANFQGVLPRIIPDDWQQPWNPFMLKWIANWFPIDYIGGNDGNWTFDGTDYRYGGKASAAGQQFIGGDVLLTPQTSFIFKDRLQKFAIAHQDSLEFNTETMLGQLDGLIQDIDGWDFISQKLVGFSQQLSVRDVRANRAPDDSETFTFSDGTQKSLTELVGDHYDHLPYIKETGDVIPFQSVRQGQFCLSYLAVYDAFGQVLEVIGDSGLSSSDLFTPIVAEGFVPDAPIMAQNPQRFVQLPPRLNQHSRLDFRLADVSDASRFADIDADANPVAGWLLPNHLDSSVSIYDSQGNAVGELAEVAAEDGSRVVEVHYAPQGLYAAIADIEARAPDLAKWLQRLTAKGTAAFEHFLEVVDATLWTIDPLGARDDQNLSVLAGRPLVLVRASLKFDLDGPPLSESGWGATFYPPSPDFTGNDYEIRLGDTEIRKDGLIGYYANQNYDTFNSVHPLEAGEASDGYIQPIKPGNYISLTFDGSAAADIMMLVDPRAAVHALTGILPVQLLELPARYVDPVLSRLDIQFTIGPLLTELQPMQGDVPLAAISLPLPTERNGQWRWFEKQVQKDNQVSWQPYELANVDEKAHLSDRPQTLREGKLQFQTNLNQKK